MDVVAILNRLQIPYRSSGQNVAKGNVVVNCPWCGGADSSGHMGINATTGYWGCWRNRLHRGKSLPRLLVQLAGITYDAAFQLTGRRVAPQADDFMQAIEALKAGPVEETQKPRKGIKLLPEFRAIYPDGPTRVFHDYLVDERGWGRLTDRVITHYNLRCAFRGPYAQRIIIPIYEHDRIVSWTGRSIRKDAGIRYLSLSEQADENKGLPAATHSLKDLLLDLDDLASGGRVLIIVEGPFDSMLFDVYAQRYDCRVTCVFGLSMTDRQVSLIREVADGFDRIAILFDHDAGGNAMELADALADVRPDVWFLPENVKDPGELSLPQMDDLLNHMILHQ